MAKVLGRDYTAASLGDNATGTTRTSIATVKDHEGLVKTCLAAETRFENARRVENLVVASEDFTNAGWVKTTTTATADQLTATGANATTLDAYTAIAGDYVFSVELKRVTGTGNIQIAADDGTWTTVTLTTSYQRFSVQQTVAAGSKNCGIRIVTSGDVVNAKNAQLELVEGQTNQNPSEYVSVGVESSPYHGAGVDGVKYFATTNPNTVSSNVVTEGTGTALTGISMLLEPAATNEATYSEDQSNAAWVASNITKGSTSQATPAGDASTAVELTASAANGTLLQSFTHASANWSYSVYLKRKTGTGNIDLTIDGGTTWTTKTITSSWARYDISQSAVTNPQFGIRIATSADAIYAWGHFLGEDSDATTTYVANTSTGATTRTTDTKISYPLTTPQSAGMAVLGLAEPQVGIGSLFKVLTFNDSSGHPIVFRGTGFGIYRIRSDPYQIEKTNTATSSIVASTWSAANRLRINIYDDAGWSTWPQSGGFPELPAGDNTVELMSDVVASIKVEYFDIYDTDEGTSWIENNYPPSGAPAYSEAYAVTASAALALAHSFAVDYSEAYAVTAAAALTLADAWSLDYAESYAVTASAELALTEAWSLDYAESYAVTAAAELALVDSYQVGNQYAESYSVSALAALGLVEAWTVDYAEAHAVNATAALALAEAWSLDYSESYAVMAAAELALAHTFDTPAPGVFDEVYAVTALAELGLIHTFTTPNALPAGIESLEAIDLGGFCAFKNRG